MLTFLVAYYEQGMGAVLVDKTEISQICTRGEYFSWDVCMPCATDYVTLLSIIVKEPAATY